MAKVKSIAEQYTQEMCKHFGGSYYAAREPGVKIQLGDIGVLKNYVFTRIGNVLNEPFNLAFTTLEDENPVQKATYVSQGSISWSASLAAEVAPVSTIVNNVGADVTLEFGKDKSTFFEALNIYHHSIENNIMLGNAILDLYKMGMWEKQWVVVTEVNVADSATILISQSSSAKVELTVSGEIGAAGISIADPSLGLKFKSAKGLGYQTLAQEGITYKFKLMGLKHNFLGKKPEFEPMSLHKIKADPDFVIETSTFSDVKDCADWPAQPGWKFNKEYLKQIQLFMEKNNGQ